MDTETLISELTQQRDRVVAAIEALTGGPAHRDYLGILRPRRRLSPAHKRRLSLLTKTRWAKAKKAGLNKI